MNINRIWAKIRFRGKNKLSVIRTMQRLITAGVPISKILETLYDQHSKNGTKKTEPLAIAISEWKKLHASGKPLSTSMADWLSPSERMIIEAGEQSGNLSQAFNDALIATSASGEITKAILFGLSYPVIMVFVLIGALWGFSTSIVPTFSIIVDPSTWTGNALRMYKVSEFVTGPGVYYGVAFVGILAVVLATLPRITGDIRPYLDKVPPWSLYKVIVGASFMISLRGFMMSGVSVPDALTKISKNAKPYLRTRTQEISKGVHMGRNLGVAMQRAGQNFPDPEIIGEIQIYSELNGFADNLDILAKEWIDDAVEKTKLSTKLLNTIMLALVAITIAFITLSIFEIQNMMTDAAKQ